MDNKELLDRVAEMIENQSLRMEQHLKSIELKIENDVTRRIDALFDGYKLTHEKQWEQQRELDVLKDKVDRLELQMQNINSKLA